jgi:hypothetical protein
MPEPVGTLWRRKNLSAPPGIKLKFLCLPSGSQSLYRLSYIGTHFGNKKENEFYCHLLTLISREL